jgi:hypothetical protein
MFCWDCYEVTKVVNAKLFFNKRHITGNDLYSTEVYRHYITSQENEEKYKEMKNKLRI